jgi:hypothetical protein
MWLEQCFLKMWGKEEEKGDDVTSFHYTRYVELNKTYLLIDSVFVWS